MKDVSFYDVVISKKDQRIISADAKVYDALGEYAIKPMNELIAIEDIDIYTNNVKNCDGKWYPSKIICPNEMFYTYISAVPDENSDFIRLTIVNAKDLLNAHSDLMKTINTFQAHLDMYEDIFFEYTPSTNSVYAYNTEIAEFDTGVYSLDEFEDLLCKRADDKQKQAVKGFFTQVKAGVGRSTTMIEGNLLNGDSTVTHTVMDEAFVFYDKDTEGVVGHIQIRRSKGTIKPTNIRHDSLTGLVDKSDIMKIARERIDENKLDGTALVIIDIDFFKGINDSFGHQFGDDVIKKVADIISNEVGNHGVSGRFGGDEFFVVLNNIKDESDIRPILKGIKNKVSATFPDKGIDRDSPLSVSIGAAVFPNDADNYDDLLTLADHCLYLAKSKGRNRYIIYTLAKHGTLDSIKLTHQNTKKINERDISYGDVIVKMFDMTLHDQDAKIEHYLTEFAEAFDIQNLLLFTGSPLKYRYAAGSQIVNDEAAMNFVEQALNSEAKSQYFSLGDFVVVNRLEMLPPHFHFIKDFLLKRDVYSYIMIRFYDHDERECVLLLTSVGKKTQWNQTHFKYYRAFVDLLSLHSLG